MGFIENRQIVRRHSKAVTAPAQEGLPDRGTLLAENALQPEPEERHHIGCFPTGQSAGTAYATEAVPSL